LIHLLIIEISFMLGLKNGIGHREMMPESIPQLRL